MKANYKAACQSKLMLKNPLTNMDSNMDIDY